MTEKGIPLVDNQREMTPFQRQVLVREFTRQNEVEQEMMEKAKNGRGPSGKTRNSGHKSANSRTEAIKDSQEDRERFVNSSVVNNE